MPSAGTARSTSTDYHESALAFLHSRGAHFVRCRPDKRLDVRRDFHIDRSIRRAPSLPDVLAHVQDGGLLAIHPPSLSSAVLDVDRGDPSRISGRWHPTLAARTRKPGRRHLWYPTTQVHTDSPFDLDGAGGHVKSKGYTCLWGDAAERLAEALDLGEDMAAAPFEVVAEQLGLWLPDTLDLVAPRRPAVDAGGHGAETFVIPKGRRNTTLFALLCADAGRAPLRASPERLTARAVELNARCNPPLSDAEVRAIVQHAAGYAARWPSEGHTREFMARQAARGRRSGERRRAAIAARDAAIRAAHAGGMSIRELATVHGVGKSTVGRVVRSIA